MIGLALGGGGAKGAAHVGVLKSFEKAGFKPNCIAGTSAGSIVASLYAFGIPLHLIEKEIQELRPMTTTGIRFGELGLFENKSIENLLEKYLGKNADLSQAPLPVAVHVTDLLSGEGVDLSSGPAIPIILASSCIPGFYVPQSIHNRLFVDGGLTENVPYQALKKLGARTTIGIDLNGGVSYPQPQGILDVMINAMDIAIDARTRDQLEQFDKVISMDLKQFSRMSSQDVLAMIEFGEKSANATFQSKNDFKFLKLKKLWKVLKS